MLELATLGLLQQESLHGYRLKQQLEAFMSGCISVNYGAIYPLLKRLEERGEVETLAEEEGEAGPNRKIYSITLQGRETWKKNMLEFPHESWVKARSRFMIKFFFFSHLTPLERLKLLDHRLMTCRLRLESKVVEPESTDRYQVTAHLRSIQVLQSEIQWLVEQLAKEKTNLCLNSSLHDS